MAFESIKMAKPKKTKQNKKKQKKVRTSYTDMNEMQMDFLDISVSVDDSWQKRGRTSHTGIVTVTDIMTGLVVDFVTE